MSDFEKLGVFYLGRPYDPATQSPKPGWLLYDSKDLVTHAVCVGMTGSGKTGLCIGLLEEAAIDGIPAIVIDPKGDIANLLLTFPDLQGRDFFPWINPDDAKKKNLTPEAFAEQEAAKWKTGLAAWGQDGARIAHLREAAEFLIYTPGSTAGLPVSILQSFSSPPPNVLNDAELLTERIGTTVTSLLHLVGLDADPMQSPEHILLSNILKTAWEAGQDLSFTVLIQQIQQPPFAKLGVMDLESVFPAKDRFGLAMRFNNLLGAPGFSTWLEGYPLDIDRILHSPTGKPRIAIFSIAHLNDTQRMFFVSLLLTQMVGWMRMQSGTTSLRALLYMDEVFGFFPPIKNPPSKAPMLTMLKQARAFGLGVVLATQNPVDLDYKGLGNTGTWFIGRLQTERDMARVLDGLEGAAANSQGGFNRRAMEQLISGLGARIFLMNNVHDDKPEVFETRWALSYLRGPLTRNQIQQLMDPIKADLSSELSPLRPVSAAPSTSVKMVGGLPTHPPVLPPGIPQHFMPIRANKPHGATLLYRPRFYGAASIHYQDAKTKLDEIREVHALVPLLDNPTPVQWDRAETVDLSPPTWIPVRPARPISRISRLPPSKPNPIRHGKRILQSGSIARKPWTCSEIQRWGWRPSLMNRNGIFDSALNNWPAKNVTRKPRLCEKNMPPRPPRWKNASGVPHKPSNGKRNRLSNTNCKRRFLSAPRCFRPFWDGRRCRARRSARRPPPSGGWAAPLRGNRMWAGPKRMLRPSNNDWPNWMPNSGRRFMH
jgi:hypothetical protein